MLESLAELTVGFPDESAFVHVRPGEGGVHGLVLECRNCSGIHGLRFIRFEWQFRLRLALLN